MNRSIMPPAVRALALVAVLTAAVAVAGCGAEPSAEGGTNQRAKFEKAAAKFKACMKKNGIEIKAEFSEDGGMMMSSTAKPGAGQGPESTKFEAANKECQKILAAARPPGAKRPEDNKKFAEQALAFAKCMRNHGIDVPDPIIEDGGRGIKQKMPNINPKSPRFQDAQKVCSKGMPGPGIGPGDADERPSVGVTQGQ